MAGKKIDLTELFERILSSYKDTHSSINGQKAQIECSAIWREIKKGKDREAVESEAKALMLQWKSEKEKPKKGSIISFLKSATKKGTSTLDSRINSAELSSLAQSVRTSSQAPTGSPDSSETQCASSTDTSKSKAAPKQDELNEKINVENEILVSLYRKRDLGQASESDRKEIISRKTTLEQLKKELKEAKSNASRQKKLRIDRKRKLESFDKITGKKLMGKVTSTIGRPEKCDNSELIQAIARIALSGSAAHERRRSEVIRTVKTLDQLTDALNSEGFQLKRSSVYLRLLPRNQRTIEGKRHVTTAPVKLYKDQNSRHASHVSTKFARASIKSLEELAAILGPNEVTFHSQDDKSKVPIGLTAANKQAPMMMHMEYQIKLPDHNFVVAPQHKLIPSVIGDMKVVNSKDLSSDAVTYSGATYIGIRSAKHSGSSAFAHFQDMTRVRSLPEFASSFRNEKEEDKKVMIVTVDGGPDENPRYEKTVNCSVKYFVDNDLDALFIATNAPGRSAFNHVERRMVKLSKELSGVLLEHDKFGSHLDAKGATIDKDLELKNFEFAGQTLAEIWSNLFIDGNPVVAEFIADDSPVITAAKSEKWKAIHVRQSQYFLQIVKCTDENCCSPFQSSFLKVLPDRFLPPPFPVVQSPYGIKWAKDDKDATYLSLYQNLVLRNTLMPSHVQTKFPKGMPYDFSCPSVKQDVLKRRTCANCGQYFGSLKANKVHVTSCMGSEINPSTEVCQERVRPLRIAARRQRELLCAMEFQEMEWMLMDDVETDGIDVENIAHADNKSGTPVIDLDEVSPVWVDDFED